MCVNRGKENSLILLWNSKRWILIRCSFSVLFLSYRSWSWNHLWHSVSQPSCESSQTGWSFIHWDIIILILLHCFLASWGMCPLCVVSLYLQPVHHANASSFCVQFDFEIFLCVVVDELIRPAHVSWCQLKWLEWLWWHDWFTETLIQRFDLSADETFLSYINIHSHIKPAVIKTVSNN